MAYTPEELKALTQLFGSDAATREAYRAAANVGTQAAAQTGLNAAAGLGSFLGPVSFISSGLNILKGLSAGSDARRAQEEAYRQTALDNMAAQGATPEQLAAAYRPVSEARGAGLPENMTMQEMFDFGLLPAQQFAPTDYGRDVVDTMGDIWSDPSRVLGVILGPGGITGNIEWGGGTIDNAPGTAPAIYTGSPAEGVLTGVDTGNEVLNAAIRKVLGQTEGGETTTTDVIAAGVEQETGIPAGTIIDILEDVLKDTGASLPSPTSTPTGGGATTTPTTSTTTGQTGGSSQTTDQQEKVTVGTDTGLFEKVMDVIRGKKTDKEIRDAAEAAGVTKEEIAKVLDLPQGEVDARWEGAGGPFDTSGNATVLDTVTGGDVLDTVTGGDVVDTVTGETVINVPEGQGPSVLEPENRPVLDVAQPPGGGGGGGGGFNLDAFLAMQPQYRTVTTTPGELAEIDYLFDIGGDSIFAPQMEEDGEEDKNLARIKNLRGVGYAQGGQVDVVELALQLLRG